MWISHTKKEVKQLKELRMKIEQLIEDLESETANRHKNDVEEGRYNALCEVIDLIDEQKK